MNVEMIEIENYSTKFILLQNILLILKYLIKIFRDIALEKAS